MRPVSSTRVPRQTTAVTFGVLTALVFGLACMTPVAYGGAGIEWIATADGNWNNPDNWAGGVVPGAGDTAIISVAESITVTISSNVTIANLTCEENLRIVGAALTVTGTATVSGTFTMLNMGNTNSLLHANGGTFTATGTTNLTNGRLSATNEGIINLPNATSYSWDLCQNVTIMNADVGEINLPNVTSLSLQVNCGATLVMSALNGGYIDLSGLGNQNTLGINSRVAATGEGLVDLSSLTASDRMTFMVGTGGSIPLNALASASGGTFDVPSGESLSVPSLTSISGMSLTISGTEPIVANALVSISGGSISLNASSSWTLPALLTITQTPVTLANGSSFTANALTGFTRTSTSAAVALTVNGTATFTAPALNDFMNNRIVLRTGAALSLPGLTSYTHNQCENQTLFDADGSGSMLNLSALQSMTFQSNCGATLVFSATNGASMNLSDVTTMSTAGINTRIAASGGGSIDLSSLTASDRTTFMLGATGMMALDALESATNGTFDVAAGGSVTVPNLQSISGMILTIGGSQPIVANALTMISGGSVTLNSGASWTLPALTTITQTPMTLANNTSFTANALTSFTRTNTSTAIALMVNGSATFTAPALSDFTSNRLILRSGAVVSLPGLTNYTHTQCENQTIFDADGTGTMLNLSALQSMNFQANCGATLVFSATNGASINFSGMTTMSTAGILSRMTASGGASIDLSSLATSDRMTFMTGATGMLALDSLATASGGTFDVASGGSVSVPSLSSISGMNLTLSGSQPVVANALTSISGGSISLNNGASWTLPALTTITQTPVTLANGSSFTANALTSFTRTNTTAAIALTVNGTAMFTAPSLNEFTNNRLVLRSGATVSLPGLTSYTNTQCENQTMFDVDGTGTMLNLSALQSMSFQANCGATLVFAATSGASIDLSGLTSMSTAGINTRIAASGGASIDLSSLTGSDRTTFMVGATGMMALDSLSSATGGTFDVASGGSVAVPSLTSISGMNLTIAGSQPVVANALVSISGGSISLNTGASWTLPALTTITQTPVTLANGSSFTANALTNFTRTSTTAAIALTVNGTAMFTAPNLSEFTNNRLILRTGAMVSLPGLTSYTNTQCENQTMFDVDGTGSMLDLSALQSISMQANCSATLMFTTSNGGRLNLSNVTNFSTNGIRAQINANGPNSVVDLSSLIAYNMMLITSSTMNGGMVLFGQVPPEPVIEVTPQQLSFGNRTVGQSSTMAFTVGNVGDAELMGSANISGGSGAFSISGSANYTVAPSGSQMIVIEFTPPTVEAFSAMVTFTGGGGAARMVTGMGVSAPEAIIDVSPSSVDFGNVDVGQGVMMSFVVENIGDAELTGSASVMGSNAFAITGGANYMLAPDAMQEVVVTFTPPSAGPFNATVMFSGGGGTMAMVSGTGVVVEEPEIDVSPPAVDFGNVTEGESLTMTFTVENTGTGTLLGSASISSGANAFSITGGGNYSLGEGEMQEVSVAFMPPSPGMFNGTVMFTGGGGAMTTVSGMGIAAEVPVLVASPLTVEFGAVQIGMSERRQVRIQNMGTGTLEGMASVPAPFSIAAGGSYSLETGAFQFIEVDYTPTAEQVDEGVMTLSGGSGGEVEMRGTGAFGVGGLTGRVQNTSGGAVSCAAVLATVGDFAEVAIVDVQGTYVFDALPATQITLHVFATGFTPLMDAVTIADGSTTTRNLTLEEQSASSTLTGMVMDDVTGDPIIGAAVEVFSGEELAALAYTCSDGTYELVLPDSKAPFRVQMSSTGYLTEVLDVDLDPDVNENLSVALSLATEFPGSLSGMVRDSADGSPIANARVVVGAILGGRSAMTNASGGFNVQNLAPGRYRVRVSANDYESSSRTVDVFSDTQAAQVQIELEFTGAGAGGGCGSHGNGMTGAGGAGDIAVMLLAMGALSLWRTRRYLGGSR